MNETYLAHYGVKGQKWGIRRTPEQLGHSRVFKQSNGGTYNSSDVVFISGKVKFDEPVPSTIKRELDRAIAAKSKIIIGDAPGADTRVQDYLSEVGYKNVTVYTTDDKVRNNVGNWKVEKISGEGYETEREVRRQKDIAMTNASTKGIAISSDDDRADSATALNIQRLIDANKSVQFYDFKKDTLSENEVSDMTHSAIDETYLAHYGVKGMKWGVRKADYDAMNKQQRKETRKQYYKTPEGKILKNTVIGTVLLGPVGGVAVGAITAAKVGKLTTEKVSDISQKTVEKGKSTIEKINPTSLKTESKKVSDLKSRVTGEKENGKPAFLMDSVEMESFRTRYERRQEALTKQYKNATDPADKQRILAESDALENDYLSVVEQDFWYIDD